MREGAIPSRRRETRQRSSPPTLRVFAKVADKKKKRWQRHFNENKKNPLLFGLLMCVCVCVCCFSSV